MTYKATFSTVEFDFYSDERIDTGDYPYHIGGTTGSFYIEISSDPQPIRQDFKLHNHKELFDKIWKDKKNIVRIEQQIATRL